MMKFRAADAASAAAEISRGSRLQVLRGTPQQ